MNAGFRQKITSESISSSGADLVQLFLLPCLFFFFLSLFSVCFSALPAHWNLPLEFILACTAVWLSINKINQLADSVRKTVYVILFSLSAADSFQFFVPATKSLFWLILPFLIGFAICRLFSAHAEKTTVLASAALGTLLAFSVYAGWQLQTYARFELLYIGRHAHYSAVRELFWFCGLSFLLSAGFFAFFSYFLNQDPSDTYADTKKRDFLLIVGLLLFFWLPYYLAFYPGFLSVDSLDEIKLQLSSGKALIIIPIFIS